MPSMFDAQCGVPLLEAVDVSAGYGRTAIVQGMNLEVRAGQWLGLLGANGSGKSTLLRAITGQIGLMRGTVKVGGHPLSGSALDAKQAFGCAVEVGELPESLTGRQYLELVASVRGCQADDWPMPGLPEHLAAAALDTAIGACSLGTRAKFSIMAALLGSPPLLILDESLNGLDPVVSWRVRLLLQDLVTSGRHAVILSTHMVEAVGGFCTDVVFMSEGRIAFRWGKMDLLVARADEGGFEAAVMSRIMANTAVAGTGLA